MTKQAKLFPIVYARKFVFLQEENVPLCFLMLKYLVKEGSKKS